MITVRKTFVDYKPPISEDYIWIDVSGAEPVQKIFLNGEWRPLKDADVDAEFATGQKVSDINISNQEPELPYTLLTERYADTKYHTNGDTKLVTPSEGVVSIDFREPKTFNTNFIVLRQEQTYTIDFQYGSTIPDIPSDAVTTIVFTSPSQPVSLRYPENLIWWANEEPVCKANTHYVIAIWGLYAVLSEFVKE